ncbi:MAG: hypothetical protein ABSF50_22395 [Burkholderiaceae bacterium]|jgi:hypothetical protein
MMGAKRVSVILAEITQKILDEKSRPADWRFELLDGADVARRVDPQNASGAQGAVFEAYSARDAHDVECALVDMGCVQIAALEDSALNFVWIERIILSGDSPKKKSASSERVRR